MDQTLDVGRTILVSVFKSRLQIQIHTWYGKENSYPIENRYGSDIGKTDTDKDRI